MIWSEFTTGEILGEVLKLVIAAEAVIFLALGIGLAVGALP